MRDLLLVSLLPLFVYFSFKRPFIGAGLWLWTSAFNINHLVYGFASSITYNRLFAITAMLSYFISKNKPKFILDKLSILILFFFFWTTLTTYMGGASENTMWTRWSEFMRIILFYCFAIAILERKRHLDFIMWLLVLSIGALAAGEGLKFLVSGGGHRIGGLRGITGDNNFFAVMILSMLPMGFYLVTQTKHKLIKQGLFIVMFLDILGLISTYSRSGFIGLAVLIVFAIKSSKNKFIWIVVLSIIISLGMNFLPEEWFGRMDTVDNAEEDGSFMHRVVVWKMCIVIALNNPLFGEGFKAIENLSLWQHYYSDFHLVSFIPSPEPLFYEPIRAAHSIYFQVLSSHGFVGLFLFLLILFSAYMKIGSIIRRAKRYKMDDWVFTLLAMLRISIIAYSLSGGTVSVAYFDFLYAIFAIIYVLDNRIVIDTNNKVEEVRYGV